VQKLRPQSAMAASVAVWAEGPAKLLAATKTAFRPGAIQTTATE